MRKWKQLSFKAKLRRILYNIKDFFIYRVLGRHTLGGLSGLYWWVRWRTTDRFHVLNLKGEDGQKPGYMDADRVLLLANFKVLRDFVEKEDPQVGLRTIEDYRYPAMTPEEEAVLETHQLAPAREIRALYDWWTKERPQAHKDLAEFIEVNLVPQAKRGAANEWVARETALYEKDTEMIVRLAKIRDWLWT